MRHVHRARPRWRPIDGYCERTGPEFWSEPLNAVTNLAFLIAALLTARSLRRRAGSPPPDLVVLVALLAAIGVGSFSFHTLATWWAGLADTLPIMLFMLSYVLVFLRRFAGLRWRLAWLGPPTFVAFTAVVAIVAGQLGWSAPTGYLPALLGLAGFAGWLASRHEPTDRHAARVFALAAGLFAVSLALRQLDPVVCSAFPVGTHFGWHLLNALVLYLITDAAIRRVSPDRVAADQQPS